MKPYLNVTKRGSFENLRSVWDQYKPKSSGHGFKHVLSNSSSENRFFWDRCKANINGYGFNNVSSYNLSRTIIVPSMDQNKSITSYDYYEPNISKEKSFLENKGFSIAKSTNADNRTNSMSFDAKPNTTFGRKEICSRTESEVGANKSLSKTKFNSLLYPRRTIRL